jgi:hypothetical protein
MKKNLLQLLSCFLLMAFVFSLNAQTPSSSKIYMPLDVRQAYEKGTRNYNGTPGASLWQNTCKYQIQVAMNPETRELNGKEWIVYSNNSPDTIKSIVFNTYLDVYKKGNPRASQIDQETDGVTLASLVIDGDTVKEKDFSSGSTYRKVSLKKYLNPHSSCKLEVKWSVIFNDQVGREGFVDNTSAFIALWYPKIAVYDDLFSWNRNNYTLKDEFYSPLSTYDVSISLPKGFLVWATGTLQNPSNYPDLINERIKNASSSSKTESIIDSLTILDPNEIGKEPWRFHADSVPDFAFAFSNHFLWDATSITLKTKKVLISTVYPKEQLPYFKDATKEARNTIEIYSNEDPGLEFPYNRFTTFYDGMGMEYPMMAFDCVLQDSAIDAYVVIHEMLHTYVPFYLRTNETKFAWLDEGLTHFYTLKMLKKQNYDMNYVNKTLAEIFYNGIEGIGNLPLITPTSYMGTDNWLGMGYIKPEQMYTALEDQLGSGVWQKCFKAFVQTWKYNSPMPYDFIFFVENYTKKDLFWFWDAWFMQYGYPDLSIQKVNNGTVTIENKGGLPIPFSLVITDEKGKQTEMTYHADSWIKGRLFEIKLTNPKPLKIEVKCDLVIDYNLKDNVWKN